jgi:hypothetical protein
MTDDIRWQQRFHDYEMAFLLLKRTMTIQPFADTN